METKLRDARLTLINFFDNEDGIPEDTFFTLREVASHAFDGKLNDILEGCETYGGMVFLDEDVAEELRGEMEAETND